MTEDREKSSQRWTIWLAIAIAIAAVSIYILLWYGPDLIARHDIGNVSGALRALRLQQARDAARGRLLTLGAGLFAAGALLFTSRNYGVARRQLELARQTMELTEQGQRRTLELTEQGQVTDRYTRAIGQLGSNKLDVRIGGIYALERIAYDSTRDHPTIMEVLTAFVREHSSERWPPAAATANMSERRTRPDIQAAVSVIGRRDGQRDVMPIDLRGVDLTAANVADAYLVGANLVGANLTEADLGGAHLRSADLVFANLAKANLADADLTTADLVNASLINASLRSACFTGADLTNANLAGADLGDADFSRASLRSADLASADLANVHLDGADLTFARWPPGLAVPKGWQRDADAAPLKRANTNPGESTT